LEGQAICTYLEKYCWEEADILSLLHYPRAAFGLSNA
jgi:hypothetical protein